MSVTVTRIKVQFPDPHIRTIIIRCSAGLGQIVNYEADPNTEGPSGGPIIPQDPLHATAIAIPRQGGPTDWMQWKVDGNLPNGGIWV